MQEKQQNMSEHISISTVLSEKKKNAEQLCEYIYIMEKKNLLLDF